MSEQNLPSKKKMASWKIGLIIILVGSIAYVQIMQQPRQAQASDPAEQAKPGTEFTKQQMGDTWPFEQIESGIVYCHESGSVLFKGNNGRTYALNGQGKTYSKSHGNLWNSADEIQITGKDISPILDKGNEQCK